MLEHTYRKIPIYIFTYRKFKREQRTPYAFLLMAYGMLINIKDKNVFL